MRIIALVNQKGGVAKTTSTQNIGAGLARADRKVLLVDLDPQGNLTEACGSDPDDLEASIYDVLIDDTPIKEVLVEVDDGLDLAPAGGDLAGAEVELLQFEDRALRLARRLRRIRGYDYVLIDCPPSLGQLTSNGLSAAREVFIPLQAEFFALKGMKKLLSTVELAKANNKALEITGVFGTRFDSRKNLNQAVIDQLRQHFGSVVFNTMIRDNVALAEAPAAGMHIFEFRGSSNGAADYRDLVAEILSQEVN